MGYDFSACEDTAQTHLVSLVNYIDKPPSFDAFTRNAINMFCSIGTLHASKKGMLLYHHAAASLS